MIHVPGYDLGERLYESAQSLVYRGKRASDGRVVVLKVLNGEYPSPTRIARFLREFDVTRRLAGAGVIEAVAFEERGDTRAIVLEDFGGESLSRKLGSRASPFDVEEVVRIGIQIAEGLDRIHALSVIHKDINPSNVVYREGASKELKIIDFGISTALSREDPEVRTPTSLEGTLAYISPEQTGRMNRGVDYRTDYYSLGATLYHLLTGRLPFATTDPLELVHCHLARIPTPPDALNAAVPRALSEIVRKLLAKTAEERYQSARGLAADLKRVLAGIGEASVPGAADRAASIEPFPLGRDDVSDRFRIPEKLYGREAEVSALLAAFERMSTSAGGVELVLVPGGAGIGKSSLIHELYRPITAKRAYFASGKFDQYRRDIPYTALIEALRSIVQQILREGEDEVAAWKRAMLSALGPNGRIVIDVIPEVELLVGPQPEVLELPPLETQNRFNLVFRDFVGVLAAADHPLVVVLDDLQWADAASLKLLELIATDQGTRHMLLIGAYRDNEVGAADPLALTLQAIERAGTKTTSISLGPLSEGHVVDLVADTLRITRPEAEPLARLCLEKTAGNPFFLGQFLGALHKEGLLAFDRGRGAWRWDVEVIRKVGITDNVVELMAAKIRKLPSACQDVLRLAACIGGTFDLATLGLAHRRAPTETAANVWPALEEGLVAPLDASYKFVSDAEASEVRYRFVHDRVQQAAYSLIAPGELAAIHLETGRLMLSSLSGEQRGERLFELINHLNLGRSLITSPKERDELARLNLEAGEKAIAAVAYEPALRYLTVGLELLGEDAFAERYDLALLLTTRAAEAANLAGKLEEMAQRVEEVLRHGKTLLDKIPAQEIQLQAYTHRGQHLEAIKLGFAILKPLGVSIPFAPNKAQIVAGLLRVKLLTAGRAIEDLAHLPVMGDPLKRAAMRVIVAITSSVFLAAPAALPVHVLEMMRLSLLYGNAPESPHAYASYALVLSGTLGDVLAGYRFGQLALGFLGRPDARKLRVNILFVLNTFVNHRRRHVREAQEPLLDAYRAGLQTGGFTYAFYSAHERCRQQLYSGVALEEVDRESGAFLQAMRRFGHQPAAQWLMLVQQMAHNLMDRAADPLRLTGEVFDEQRFQAALGGSGNFHLQKLILAYLFHDHRAAVEHAALAEGAQTLTNMIGFPILIGYAALAELALCGGAPKSEQKRALRKVLGLRKKMKSFAEHAPENHAHRLELIDAEVARVSGDTAKARQAYDRAIELARQNGYVNDEAVASEVAARFYMGIGKDRIAEVYWRDARYAYLRWGAIAKVSDLDARFPAFAEKSRPSSSEVVDAPTVTRSSRTGALDLLSVMKASQAISSEIVLDGLLRKLMATLLESAGATRGVLILKGDFPRVVEATHASEKDIAIREVDRDARGAFAESVVRFVERTLENVVLADAAVGPFQSDAYIKQNKPRSILCSPVVRQKKLLAVLYMENNLTANAFTPERCELLELLSAQTAISLENALLYDTLENRVKERTRELSEALEQLKETQKQLVTQEKLASLGMLASGIAHEIKNPLNFVNNFAEINVSLAGELLEELEKQRPRLDPGSLEYVEEILGDLRQNAAKIHEHGARADGIVRSMLEHSRTSKGESREVDLNTLIREYVSLAYHGLRAQSPSFDVAVEARLDDAMPPVSVVSEEMGRVLLNLFNNAFYAALAKKKKARGGSFAPAVTVMSRDLSDRVEVRVRDNGDGIPAPAREKIFNPFFTTKPPGEGTGLGLSISYDIVVQRHGGTIAFESEEGSYTEFCVTLPKRSAKAATRG